MRYGNAGQGTGSVSSCGQRKHPGFVLWDTRLGRNQGAACGNDGEERAVRVRRNVASGPVGGRRDREERSALPSWSS